VEDIQGKEYRVTAFSDVLEQKICYGKEVAGAEADVSEQLLSLLNLNYTITKRIQFHVYLHVFSGYR